MPSPFSIFDNMRRKKNKEVKKNAPEFLKLYKEICKKTNICLEPRLDIKDGVAKPYLAMIHLEDQKDGEEKNSEEPKK